MMMISKTKVHSSYSLTRADKPILVFLDCGIVTEMTLRVCH
jgi:hypothetical protein